MATLYKCDRCHVIGKDPLEKIEIPKLENNYRYKNDRQLDICDDCLKKLNEFMDPIAVISQG